MRRGKAKTIGGGAALTFDGPMVVGPDRDARRGGGRGPVPAYHSTARHRRRSHQEPSGKAPVFHPRLGQPVVFVPPAPTSPFPSPHPPAPAAKKSRAHPSPCTLSCVPDLRHISRTEAELFLPCLTNTEAISHRSYHLLIYKDVVILVIHSIKYESRWVYPLFSSLKSNIRYDKFIPNIIDDPISIIIDAQLNAP
jgi:hypothetical protein